MRLALLAASLVAACGAPALPDLVRTPPKGFEGMDARRLETPCGPPSVPEAICDRRNRVVGVWTDESAPGAVSGWLAPDVTISTTADGPTLWVRASCMPCRMPSGWSFVGTPARMNEGQRKILAERMRLSTVPGDADGFVDAAKSVAR